MVLGHSMPDYMNEKLVKKNFASYLKIDIVMGIVDPLHTMILWSLALPGILLSNMVWYADKILKVVQNL